MVRGWWATRFPPGIYSAAGGAQCSWKRLSGFGGTFDDTIAGDFGVVRPIVEITPTDNGFSTSGCGLWTLVMPPSTPTPTPAAALTPTSTPTQVASATPKSVVIIPQGWKRIEDDRLGYSLAVPFPWLTFDLQSRVLDPVANLLGGEDAMKLLREFLDSPEGSSLGILAVEPDLSQLFASPPFPMFLNVSIAPMPDEVTAEQLVAFVKGSAETLDDVQLYSIRTGAVNEMPALQVVANADLSGMGFDVAPHLVITILRANQTAYHSDDRNPVERGQRQASPDRSDCRYFPPRSASANGYTDSRANGYTDSRANRYANANTRTGRRCQAGNLPRRR